MYCFNTDQEFDHCIMGEYKDSLGNPPKKLCPCCLMMKEDENYERTHGIGDQIPVSAERAALTFEGIGNYYGTLNVTMYEGKAYWSIEDYAGCSWKEIPMSLYNELIKFEQGE